MNLLYCSGELEAYREALRKAGGVEVVFPGDIDILPYLKKNNLCFYVDSGFLDVQFQTSTLEIYEPISYIAGSLVFDEMLYLKDCHAVKCQLIPAEKGVRGLIIPKKNLKKSVQEEEIKTTLLHLFQKVASINAANTVFFHQGDGIRRICNYLWSYEAARLEVDDIPYITQERIAYKTMLSQSQVTRVLSKLRRESVIETRYRTIQIINRERIKKYLSLELWENKDNK